MTVILCIMGAGFVIVGVIFGVMASHLMARNEKDALIAAPLATACILGGITIVALALGYEIRL